ncbi:hypothetical protein LSAT2_023574 [Lamellibrachia satsuma]|nr:hypothetical protein LSAT2_023574 [Lamellibrachia satsuma]
MYSQRLCCVAVLATTLLVVTGSTQYDSNKRYIRYVTGSLNVIITAPHGGHLLPSSIPNRVAGCFDVNTGCDYHHNCGTPDPQNCPVKLLKDSYTSSIATTIANELESLTGDRPHTIYCRLHRRKMDANREVNEATLNVQEAIYAYNNFTAFVNAAKTSIGGRALLLDIHGQTHVANWTELGYAVSASKLNSGLFSASDSTIKAIGLHVCIAINHLRRHTLTGPFVGVSIGRFLQRSFSIWKSYNNACFKDLLRNTTPNSLGHYLRNEAYRVVPSPVFPSPGSNGYYSGGYNVKTHGSRNGGLVDAIQVEIPKEERFSSVRRTNFAKAVARAVKHFMDDHY